MKLPINEGRGLIHQFTETLQGLERVSPQFASEPRSPEAEKEVRAVFYGPEAQLLDDEKVRVNMEYFCARYMAIVEQAENNPAWQRRLAQVAEGRRHDAAASKKEMAKAPRTMEKTVQERWGHRLFRMDLKRDELGEGTIMDPAQLTDTRLQVLRVIPRPTPGVKKQRESRQEKLNRMIDHLPQVQEAVHNLRPLVFEHETNALDLNYFRLSYTPDGYIVGTSSLGNAEADGEDKYFFGSRLDEVERMIEDHIKEGYDQERAKLSEIVDITQEIAGKIREDWPEAKKKIRQYRRKLLKLVDSLKYVRNPHKLEMRRRIESSVDVKYVRTVPAKFGWKDDVTRGVERPAKKITVYNPGAAVSSLVSLPLLAGKRRQEMSDISACLGNDAARVRDYAIAQEKPFGRFYNQVREQQSRFRILNVDDSISPEDLARISGNLSSLASQCDPHARVTYMKPFLEPHLAFAEKMHGHLRDAANQIGTKPEEREAAAESFIKAYLIAKIQHFYIELRQFYREDLAGAMRTEEVDLDSLMARVNRLGQMIGEKDVYVYRNDDEGCKYKEIIPTPEYDDIYGGLYHLLNSLRKRLREAKKLISDSHQGNLPGVGEENLTEEEIAKAVRGKLLEMKNRIKEMRFEDLIRRGKEEETVTVCEDETPGLRKTLPPEASEQPQQEQA